MQESTLSMNGNINFTANTSGSSGGAIYAALDCSAVFDGSSTFSRNSATYGGAIAVDEGKCTLSGNSSFVLNSGISGGAIFIHGNQLFLIGEHKFTSNVAKFVGYGGAIRALRTNVMLSGNQFFTNNSSMYGGDMAVSNYNLKDLIQFPTNTYTYFCYYGNSCLICLIFTRGSTLVSKVIRTGDH